ncbi:MAG: OsmC family protein [Actinomycetota bacterium]
MTVTESTPTTPVNGVNVEALLGARQALTDAPEAAAFTWRATCDWVLGTHARTEVQGFFGLGQEHERSGHSVDTDHPEIFASADNGMTPVEAVLSGLVGCLTAGVASVATNRGIELRSVKATVEGDMDLQGILGIDGDVRNGFNGVRVDFDIDADASDEEIAAIVAQSQKRSAVFDIVTNPTTVTVSA